MRPGDYALSNPPKPEERSQAHETLIGKGDEHRSRVKPGPPPTLAADGVQECAHCAACFVIEGIVGLLGVFFGAANEQPGQRGTMESAVALVLGL